MFRNVKQVNSTPKVKRKENIYSKEIRNQLLDEGALNNEEDGFMEGYAEEEYIEDYDDDDESNLKSSEFIGEMY